LGGGREEERNDWERKERIGKGIEERKSIV
jgi:hypothetical protein